MGAWGVLRAPMSDVRSARVLLLCAPKQDLTLLRGRGLPWPVLSRVSGFGRGSPLFSVRLSG